VLLGRLRGVQEGRLVRGDDLAANVARGDEQACQFLQTIDEHIRAQGLEAPAEEWPRDLRPPHGSVPEAPTELDLARAGIATVIWATGYRPDLEWVGLPFLDAEGYPVQRRGVTTIPGLSILGLDWLHTAGSGIFPGIGEDAGYLAAHMAGYLVAS
jgi:putative flavoprotein involved in K+ transport